MTAVADHPRECSEVWWGKRLAAARVDLDSGRARAAARLLEDAWETKRAGPAGR